MLLMWTKTTLTCLIIFSVNVFNIYADDRYQLGVGIGDITGPAAQINMMGYAKPEQLTAGIHTRLWSRAFIIGQSSQYVVFVSIDAGMISQYVRSQVIANLKNIIGDDRYNESNVCLSATHTHSGPAGFFQYFLYDITSLGFVQATFDAMVDGIVKSIVEAHKSLQNGYIYYNQGELHDVSINRSPSAYLQNPQNERESYIKDVDTRMFLLKLTDIDNKPLGMINWFAVHGTSMNSSNYLISSDNKGYASLLFEERINTRSVLPGQGKFVAAFAQSNEGDVSPNILGPKCQDTGRLCDVATSTCNGRCQKCISSGPGEDMFESTKIIGERQFNYAWDLWSNAERRISGPVKFIYQRVNMSDTEVKLSSSLTVKTCPPALGHSFAAGTIDGPGEFDFHQHIVAGSENPMWNIIVDTFLSPSAHVKECHLPKPVLVPQESVPVQWMPEIVPTQILQIGNLIVVAAPGEFTTMAGRRLREAVDQVTSHGSVGYFSFVVLAGLSNIYTNYVATKEEYDYQRYEGASTLYGRHTLDAYVQIYRNLADHMINDKPISLGPEAPKAPKNLPSFAPTPLFESPPLGKRFGDVLKDVNANYNHNQIVEVKFVSANPQSGIKLDSFLYVEQQESNNSWSVVASDANWETKFEWKSTNRLLGQSEVTIYWTIPNDIQSGNYRIKHLGLYKNLIGNLINYEGVSKTFSIG